MMYNNGMHRTQVLLEDRQYAALRTWARRADMGLSEMIRLAVERLLGSEKKAGPSRRLKDICAIRSDSGGPSGGEHDKILYGGGG